MSYVRLFYIYTYCFFPENYLSNIYQHTTGCITYHNKHVHYKKHKQNKNIK